VLSGQIAGLSICAQVEIATAQQRYTAVMFGITITLTARDNRGDKDEPWRVDGGTFSPNFANLDSGWYLTTTDSRYAAERDECLKWWCPACDMIVESYLQKYGILALAFEREIQKSIKVEVPTAGSFPRYWSYFLLSRILSQPALRVHFVDDYKARGRTTWDCELCGVTTRLDNVRGSLVARTGGLLPLCDRCWNWLAILTPLAGLDKVPSAFCNQLKELALVRTCPVCQSPSAWISRADQASLDVPFLPDRYFDICNRCSTRAITGSGRLKITPADYKAIRRISEIIGGVPSESTLLFDRAPSLESAVEVIKLLHKLPSRTVLKKEAGSWLKLLILSGVLPDGTRRTRFGTMVVARDGHDCLSLAENEIDDLFTEYGIAHEREPHYPGSNYKADWSFVVGNKIIFVEYFGLASRAEYSKRMKIKLQLAAAAGIQVVQFLPEDLKDLRAVFKERILGTIESSDARNTS
jgi:hypothetical protein